MTYVRKRTSTTFRRGLSSGVRKRVTTRPSLSKKTYTKFGTAAKAKRTTIARAARARPGTQKLKALTLSNARAITRLQAAKYGPVQTNYSHMAVIDPANTPHPGVHVTSNYPACLHLNTLYCGQTGEPQNKWIQSNTIFFGQHQPVMDNYAKANPKFAPMHSLMKSDQGLQPRPDGSTILWESTTLRFKFTAWVPETYADIYIVKQKVRNAPDPWNIQALGANHSRQYLPYILPQWRNIGSKPFSGNWIDRSQYNIIAHRKLFLDSVAEVPPVGLLHATADNVVDTVTGQGDPGHQAHATKSASTHACKYATITITPKMVMSQLRSSIDQSGNDDPMYNANPNESNTEGAWSYDNISPDQNIWAIVTTSDPGHDQLDPSHAVRFLCERVNKWRDISDQHRLSNNNH